MSLRDQILHSLPPSETVMIPEWESYVLVVGMTGAQRDELDRMALNGKSLSPNLRAVICRMCVHDPETRIALFSKEDEAQLGGLSGSALDRVLEAAQRLSGIGSDAIEREKKD